MDEEYAIVIPNVWAGGNHSVAGLTLLASVGAVRPVSGDDIARWKAGVL